MTEIILQLTGKQRSAIEQHAERAYPDECCGAILGRLDGETRIVHDLIEMENTWDPEERRRRFLITAEEVMRVERAARERDLDVLGYYHSHPDAPAQPSEFDREHAWPWLMYPIASVRDGTIADLRSWQLSDDRSAYKEVPIQQRQESRTAS
ncbi:MAG: M67 family metallopeptidase [Chloroflexota bacterium]